MNEQKKQERISIIRILGKHIERYINVFIFVNTVMSILELGLIIYWFFEPDSANLKIDDIYLVLYIILFFTSVFSVIIMYLNKKGKISSFRLAVWLHISVIIMFGWSTAISIMDMKSSISPLVFLTTIMITGGILVVDPIFFSVLVIASTITIFGFDGVKNYQYFNGNGEIINFFFFIGFAIILSYRHFNVTVREFRSKDRLEQLTYYDDLTGLLNERSYMMEVDKINGAIARGEDVKFGLVVMDVNNLKVTNDTYGHRYGCHLIVRCGHVLPTIFRSSKLFHVGGDEFIAIVYGEDLENFEERINEFDRVLRYSHIEYEAKDLIFSVARGTALFSEELNSYKTVFNYADKSMYDNKIKIKNEYNLKSR